MKKRIEVKIYALSDYQDNVFYIGCTTRGLKHRLQLHLSQCKVYESWSNSLKNQKIRSLNFEVKIKELQTVSVVARDLRSAQKSAEHIEEKWIKAYLNIGVDLCNCEFTDNKTVKGSTKNKVRTGKNPNIIATVSENM